MKWCEEAYINDPFWSEGGIYGLAMMRQQTLISRDPRENHIFDHKKDKEVVGFIETG